MTAPAAQVAPALVSLGQTRGGIQRLTLHLQPDNLGAVQIRIDRTTDAPARVAITVQRPQTLELLQRDQPQLQHALDQAGVPPDGRTLTLHLAPQDGGGLAGSQGNPFGFGDQREAWSGSGSADSGARHGSQPPGDAEHDGGSDPQPGSMRWLRAGLDITA